MLAADQFVIEPATRTAETTRARAAGGEARSVIAGYHWFTDWGRDTMISLEGLTLCTGRITEARGILLTFARHLRDGLIPNLFPEGGQEGLYNTADATLWFFHAIDRYVTLSNDGDTLRDLLPALEEIVRMHRAGTRFGIRVDDDGLADAGRGEPGADVDGCEGRRLGRHPAARQDRRDQRTLVQRGSAACRTGIALSTATQAIWTRSRNARGSRSTGGSGSPTVSTSTTSSMEMRATIRRSGRIRSSRSLCAIQCSTRRAGNGSSMSSPSVCSRRTVCERSTLGHTDFKAQYFGDLRARDAAYHQGTVWAWLIGPFIDAWLRAYPGRQHEARAFLAAFDSHLSDACIGTISEVFDASEPYAPRGCIAQAWSVAEVLRSLIDLEMAAEGSRVSRRDGGSSRSRAWVRPRSGRSRLHRVGACATRGRARPRRKGRRADEPAGRVATSRSRCRTCARASDTGSGWRRGFARIRSRVFSPTDHSDRR